MVFYIIKCLWCLYFNALTGRATLLSLTVHGRSDNIVVLAMFTSLDSIGSAVGKRPIGHAIATSEWPTEY